MKGALKKVIVFAVVTLFLVSGLCYFSQNQKPVVVTPKVPDGWTAKPMSIIVNSDPSATPDGYSPTQIRAAYGLPASGGAGSTIALIEAYDTPSIQSDLTAFSEQFGLPAPSSSNFEIHKMATTLPTATDDWMQETCLDSEWAHAIAPNAKILLVQAIDNGGGLLSALDYARGRSDVVAISMSWGGEEGSWQLSDDPLLTSSYDAVFFVSSGDKGTSSPLTWPASSPNVVAVGGTTLNLAADGSVTSETAWSGSGGGISTVEPEPNYQTTYGITATGRCVPDVAYNADPATGFSVYCNGGWYVVGGTSAGAPQWAAIHAISYSSTNPNLYARAKSDYTSYFRDITAGSNGGYSAAVGYDKVTGLGSPITTNFNPQGDPGGGGGELFVTPEAPNSGVLLALAIVATVAFSSVVKRKGKKS